MVKYPYGKTSSARLATCSDAVQRVMLRASNYLNISILCGHRNRADQEEAFGMGFSKVQFPNSEHNSEPSNAVDAGIYRPDIRNVDYKDHAAFSYLAGVIHVCAEEEGCVAIYGHDWDHDFNFNEHGFKDRPHFTILTKEEYNRRNG